MSCHITRVQLFGAIVFTWFLTTALAEDLTVSRAVTNNTGQRCGIKAHLKVPHDPEYPAGDLVFAPTESDCADICRRRINDPSQYQDDESVPSFSFLNARLWCKSFFYDTSAKICQVGLKSVVEAARKTSRGNDIFYDSSCLGPVDFCDQDFGTQLLTNGDFEQRTFGPWNTLYGSVVKGYNSARAFGCELGSSCGLAQGVNLCQGELYSLKFDYKIPTKGRNPFISTVVGLRPGYDPAPNFTLEYATPPVSPSKNPTWSHAQLYLRVDGNHDGPGFLFSGDHNTTFAVDNVVLQRLPQPKLEPGAQSVIANGGFETGSLPPSWKVAPNNKPFCVAQTKVVSPGLKGSKYALRWRIPQSQGYDYCYRSIRQTVSTSPQTPYLFQFDSFVPGGSDTFWTLTFGTDRISNYITRRAGNSTFSIPIFATANRTFVFLEVNSGPSNQSIYLDNFAFTKIQSSEYY